MLWPITAERAADGVLSVGGVSLADLASEFGTPLYIYDVATIRARCRRYTGASRDAYPQARVVTKGGASE